MMQPIQPVYPQCVQVPNTPAVAADTKCTAEQCADNKAYLREQCMAVSMDISAEYNAVAGLNNVLAGLIEKNKVEKDPEIKKTIEARISTINNMILQREEKINQMEAVKKQIEVQIQ